MIHYIIYSYAHVHNNIRTSSMPELASRRLSGHLTPSESYVRGAKSSNTQATPPEEFAQRILVWIRRHRTCHFREHATSAPAELGGDIHKVSQNRAHTLVLLQARKLHVYGSGTLGAFCRKVESIMWYGCCQSLLSSGECIWMNAYLKTIAWLENYQKTSRHMIVVNLPLRPVRLLRVSISEGLTQENS